MAYRNHALERPDVCFSRQGWERLSDIISAFFDDKPDVRILHIGNDSSTLIALLRERFPHSILYESAECEHFLDTFQAGHITDLNSNPTPARTSSDNNNTFDLIVISPCECSRNELKILRKASSLLSSDGTIVSYSANPHYPLRNIHRCSSSKPYSKSVLKTPSSHRKELIQPFKAAGLDVESYCLSGFTFDRQNSRLNGLLQKFNTLADRVLFENTLLGEHFGALIFLVAKKKTKPAAPSCPACTHRGCRRYFLAFPYRFFRCRNCGTRFALPLFGVKDNHATYHSDWDADLYIAYYENLRRDHAKLILKSIQSLACEKTLLDIGCGYGFFVDEARKAGYEAYGIDPGLPQSSATSSQEFLSKCTLEDYANNTRDNKFCIISLLGVLEHVLNLSRFLSTLNTTTLSNNVVVISIPTTQFATIYWFCFTLYRISFGIIKNPILTILQWGTAAPHIFLATKKGFKDLVARELDAEVAATYAQPITSIANIHTRVMMEKKRVGLGWLSTAVMYAGGLTFSIFDRFMGLLGIPNEAVYIIRPKAHVSSAKKGIDQ